MNPGGPGQGFNSYARYFPNHMFSYIRWFSLEEFLDLYFFWSRFDALTRAFGTRNFSAQMFKQNILKFLYFLPPLYLFDNEFKPEKSGFLQGLNFESIMNSAKTYCCVQNIREI